MRWNVQVCASWGSIDPEFGPPTLAMTNDTRLIRILSLDDHPLLRSGIAALVDTQPDMRMVGEASNGIEAVQLHRQLNPDVTLMDLQMPDMSGLDVLRSERPLRPRLLAADIVPVHGAAHACQQFVRSERLY